MQVAAPEIGENIVVEVEVGHTDGMNVLPAARLIAQMSFPVPALLTELQMFP